MTSGSFPKIDGDILYAEDVNKVYANSLTQSGLNTIRQLIDRAITYSAGGIDGWGEAYIDASGRSDSVDVYQTSALFDTNKYKFDNTTSTTSAHGDTSSSGSAISNKSGSKWMSFCNATLTTIVKHNSCTATKAYVYSEDGTTQLASATFSGNNATFSLAITENTTYQLMVDNNGSNYNFVGYATATPALFRNGCGLWTDGWYNNASYGNLMNIVSVTVSSPTRTSNIISHIIPQGKIELESIHSSIGVPMYSSYKSGDSVYYKIKDINPYKSLSISDKTSGGVRDMYIKPDGLKVYIVDDNSNKIFQYECSTAWDINSAYYVSEYSISEDGNPNGIWIKPDGTKMYVIGLATNKIYQYTLSTPWDSSTASYDSVNLDVSGTDSACINIKMNNDGTKLYFGGRTNRKIFCFTMSSAYDLTTATSTNNLDLGTTYERPTSFAFNSDASKIFVYTDNKKLYQFSLGTNYDLSTSSYDNKFFIPQDPEHPYDSGYFDHYGLYIRPTNTTLYIVENVKKNINQYNMIINDISSIDTETSYYEVNNPIEINSLTLKNSPSRITIKISPTNSTSNGTPSLYGFWTKLM